MNIHPLPPKMTLQFAERAKRGEYDNYVGSNIYEFFQGNQVICIIGLSHPVGHIQKVSTQEMARRKSEATTREGQKP
jgi:hypothetical protein